MKPFRARGMSASAEKDGTGTLPDWRKNPEIANGEDATNLAMLAAPGPRRSPGLGSREGRLPSAGPSDLTLLRSNGDGQSVVGERIYDGGLNID
jgi:hypothetical protein